MVWPWPNRPAVCQCRWMQSPQTRLWRSRCISIFSFLVRMSETNIALYRMSASSVSAGECRAPNPPAELEFVVAFWTSDKVSNLNQAIACHSKNTRQQNSSRDSWQCNWFRWESKQVAQSNEPEEGHGIYAHSGKTKSHHKATVEFANHVSIHPRNQMRSVRLSRITYRITASGRLFIDVPNTTASPTAVHPFCYLAFAVFRLV